MENFKNCTITEIEDYMNSKKKEILKGRDLSELTTEELIALKNFQMEVNKKLEERYNDKIQKLEDMKENISNLIAELKNMKKGS